MRFLKIKIIDWYIIRKFLTTFFFALGLIILIAIVFDVSEKIDDFLEKKAPLESIVFDYYLNFIPYFANLFSPLFIFISVIFFTSKMASQTEIVAILSSGVSFRRMLAPYMVVAAILAALSFYLNGWVIPHSNKTRLAFENTYIKNPYVLKSRNIHRQIFPGQFIYFESYNTIDNIGFRFSFERFDKGELVYKLSSERLVWDTSDGHWRAENYMIREITGLTESTREGLHFDTTFSFTAEEFNRREIFIQAMDNKELNAHIDEKKMRGAEGLQFDEVEKYRRSSYPFATFILTLIGVSLSSRKVRGGIGIQIGVGILLSFTYILFMQVSTTFATNGNFPAMLAVWIPNIAYAGIAIILLRTAPK
ncbi:MAG TPA: LptF/LptG family permease [Bacteroidia bacterium]|nr:LptF/LptG family permease [Bacteroidia bacterium]